MKARDYHAKHLEMIADGKTIDEAVEEIAFAMIGEVEKAALINNEKILYNKIIEVFQKWNALSRLEPTYITDGLKAFMFSEIPVSKRLFDKYNR